MMLYRNDSMRAAFLVVMSVCMSCCRDVESIDKGASYDIIGSIDFYAELAYLNAFNTKAAELSDQEIIELIQPLFAPATEYLELNKYDYSSDFEVGDPRIILTALGLLELDLYLSSQTKAPGFFDVVSCIFIGESLRDLAGTGTILIAKRIASRLLERAIPYVGTAVMVVSTASCLYEQWD